MRKPQIEQKWEGNKIVQLTECVAPQARFQHNYIVTLKMWGGIIRPARYEVVQLTFNEIIEEWVRSRCVTGLNYSRAVVLHSAHVSLLEDRYASRS